MKENQLKKKIVSGQKVFGTWSMLSSPALINVIGYTDMDFVIIDLEHGPTGFVTVEHQLYAAEASGISPIVRVGDSSEFNLLHALEIGAKNIMVSHIKNVDSARSVAKAVRYAPEGDRGLSPFTRNHGYSDIELGESMKRVNEEIFLGVLVEGKEGIESLEEICKVPGINMVYLGIYDLTQYLGLPGQVNHPEVLKLMTDCAKIIQSHNLVAGSVARDKAFIKVLFDAGFQFIAYRADAPILKEGFDQAVQWFKEL